ncbi:MAG: hypothetical protein WDA21_04745 [Bacilli bacterium]
METNNLSDYTMCKIRSYLNKKNIIGIKTILEEADTISREKINKLIRRLKEDKVTLPFLIFILTHKLTDAELEGIIMIYNIFSNPNKTIIDNILNKEYNQFQIFKIYKMFNYNLDQNIIEIISQKHIAHFEMETFMANLDLNFNKEEIAFFASEENLKKTNDDLNVLLKVAGVLKGNLFSVSEKEKIIEWFNLYDKNDNNKPDVYLIEKLTSKLTDSQHKNNIKNFLLKNISLNDFVFFENMLKLPESNFYKYVDLQNSTSIIEKFEEKLDNLFSLMTNYKTIKEKPTNEILLNYITKFNPLKPLEPIVFKPKVI